jgi:hypothetical protein
MLFWANEQSDSACPCDRDRARQWLSMAAHAAHRRPFARFVSPFISRAFHSKRRAAPASPAEPRSEETALCLDTVAGPVENPCGRPFFLIRCRVTIGAPGLCRSFFFLFPVYPGRVPWLEGQEGFVPMPSRLMQSRPQRPGARTERRRWWRGFCGSSRQRGVLWRIFSAGAAFFSVGDGREPGSQ